MYAVSICIALHCAGVPVRIRQLTMWHRVGGGGSGGVRHVRLLSTSTSSELVRSSGASNRCVCGRGVVVVGGWVSTELWESHRGADTELDVLSHDESHLT
jgi:hypothetical protein